MSTGATLRAADGTTPTQLLKATAARVAPLSEALMNVAAETARAVIAEEGSLHYVRARKTRRPIRLGAKLGPTSNKKAIVYGIPAGFWSIVEKGSTRTWRIERLGGRNRRAQLLRTPYGPRPYVIRHGVRPSGHPWEKAMARIRTLPDQQFDPVVNKAFAAIWRS